MKRPRKNKALEINQRQKISFNPIFVLADSDGGSEIGHSMSTDIYEEAAHFLGLSCTLSNSCRCLECQVRIQTRFAHKDRDPLEMDF